MKYPSYPEYKDSGIEWMGEVPKQWRKIKLKYVTKQITDGAHITPTYVDNGIPFLRVTDIQTKSINLDDVKYIPVEEHYELIKRCRPEKGDLLLSKNGTIGITKVIDWDYEFSIFVSLCLIKFCHQLSPSYFSYFFESDVTNQQILEGSKKTSVTNLHLEKIKELLIVLPDINDQQSIANFLDTKTSLIDDLISKKEKQIELLNEKSTAIINRAVTKGLNPNVPMKDSGIDWLGEVPEHWEIKKLGYLCQKIGSGKTPLGGAETYVDEGVLFLRSQNVYDHGLYLDDVVYISEATNSEMYWSRVQSGDILLNITGASLGRTCLVPEGFAPANVNQHVCIIRLINTKLVSFVSMSMKSCFVKSQIGASQTGAAREGLNFEQISKLFICLPPSGECEFIVEFLGKISSDINELTNNIQLQIEKLREYRQSLISAAVTGKIDVREKVHAS